MLRAILKRWSDWSGDSSLDRAIRAELRRQRLGVHAAKTRGVRLVAIERPGWVQVRRFEVQTVDAAKRPITLMGLARDDGRKSRIELLLTRNAQELRSQLDEWSEGLIRRG